MVVSFYGQNESFVLNHHRIRKIGDGFLLTTDHGGWAYLSSEEYRDFIKGKLEGGVLREQGLILDSQTTRRVVEDYRRKCGYLFQGASLHIVVPTLRCNLKCVYCHADSKRLHEKGYDMSEETAKKMVHFIFQSPSKAINIEFQGGEPLLNFDVIKFVVEYAKEINKRYGKNVSFSIVTNLTVMTEGILDYCIESGIALCTSLDGDKIVHNKNREKYDETVRWVKRIRQKGKRLAAMTVVTRHSLPYYKEIVDEYVRLGFDTIWLKPANLLGAAIGNWNEIGIEPAEYLEFWKRSLAYIVECNRGTLLIENQAAIILKKILKKDCYNFTDLESPCGAAIAQLAYNYDGNIFTCDEARLFELFKLGTVSDNYQKILSSKEAMGIVTASLNDNPSCEICAYKTYCGICPVCSYSETGNIIPKIPNKRCRITAGMFDHVFDKLINDKEYRAVFLKWLD